MGCAGTPSLSEPGKTRYLVVDCDKSRLRINRVPIRRDAVFGRVFSSRGIFRLIFFFASSIISPSRTQCKYNRKMRTKRSSNSFRNARHAYNRGSRLVSSGLALSLSVSRVTHNIFCARPFSGQPANSCDENYGRRARVYFRMGVKPEIRREYAKCKTELCGTPANPAQNCTRAMIYVVCVRIVRITILHQQTKQKK